MMISTVSLGSSAVDQNLGVGEGLATLFEVGVRAHGSSLMTFLWEQETQVLP